MIPGKSWTEMKFESIEHPIRWLFLFHAVGGAVALASFLIPLMSKKGGKLHIKAGWVYSYAMVFVGLSAFVITPWRVFFDPARIGTSTGFSAFLFFISAFTLTSLWYGLNVLKFKNRKRPSRALLHIGPPMVLIVLGLSTQVLGFVLQDTLLIAFPFLSHFTAKNQLSYWLGSPNAKMHWWYAHMNGMFTACIATVTAFLVTAAPRIWPAPWTGSPLLWIAPGVIFGTLLNRWTSFYKQKFGDQEGPGKALG